MYVVEIFGGKRRIGIDWLFRQSIVWRFVTLVVVKFYSRHESWRNSCLAPSEKVRRNLASPSIVTIKHILVIGIHIF